MKDVVRIVCAALIMLGGIAGAVAVVVTVDYGESKGDVFVMAAIVIGVSAWCAVRIANTSDET